MIDLYGVTEAGQLRGRQHPPPARWRAADYPREQRGNRRAGARRRAKGAARGPRNGGSARASTTSASPRGTRWRSPPWPRPARSSSATTTWRRRGACAEFVLGELRDDRGRLLRTFKDGEGRLNAYLEDHAFLLEALLALYEASFEQRWYEQARELAETMIARFGDPERGGFYSTSDDHEGLIARRKEIGDHPIPSGNSSAAMGLLRLAALSGERSYERQAEARLPPLRAAGHAPSGQLRPPAAGARLPPLPDPRGRPGRRRPGAAGRGGPRRPPPPPGPRRRRRGQRARRSCWRRGRRSTAGRPPTSASTSAAARR